ncbi:hypothetical protein [Ferrovibrio xuzhouensis]|uniref:Uncharacterized protein n=1 Tax=Ferrovibrio xuzhouensis TaxID=1576914 RepID=A0ABV7VBM3_9PROT
MKSIEDLVSFWLFAALVTVFGLVGLVLAAGAKDDSIAAFGLLLAGFAVLFDYWAISYAHDHAE